MVEEIMFEKLKKDTLILEENARELSSLIDEIRGLSRNAAAEQDVSYELEMSINVIVDTLDHIVGDNLAHVVMYDKKYNETNRKVGLDKDIEQLCESYKDWTIGKTYKGSI